MSRNLRGRLNELKEKVRDRVTRETRGASRAAREDYHAVKQRARQTAREQVEAQRQKETGIKNLQRTTEMADPVGTTLQPATAPENVQYLVSRPPGHRESADGMVTGGGGSFGVENMVTGTAEGRGDDTQAADPLVSMGIDRDGDRVAGSPADDDIVLPGEGDSEW